VRESEEIDEREGEKEDRRERVVEEDDEGEE
jgi:hypothetical protein